MFPVLLLQLRLGSLSLAPFLLPLNAKLVLLVPPLLLGIIPSGGSLGIIPIHYSYRTIIKFRTWHITWWWESQVFSDLVAISGPGPGQCRSWRAYSSRGCCDPGWRSWWACCGAKALAGPVPAYYWWQVTGQLWLFSLGLIVSFWTHRWLNISNLSTNANNFLDGFWRYLIISFGFFL